MCRCLSCQQFFLLLQCQSLYQTGLLFLAQNLSCSIQCPVSWQYLSTTHQVHVPPSGFGSLFYELGSSEVRVSLDCEINRLLVSVYTWVGVIYLLLFKTDIKISFPYLCLAVKRHSPTDHRHDESYGLQVWSVQCAQEERRFIGRLT